MPKIEKIKKSTLAIFIFSYAWTINNLTNFIIKTKIDKLINDVFKADDLKGPIFDYYFDEENFDLCNWEKIIKPKLEFISSNYFNNNQIFYYNKIFIPNKENFPIYLLSKKLIDNNISFYLTGKENCGKTILLDNLLIKNNESIKQYNSIKYITSYNSTSNELKTFLLNNLNEIKFIKKLIKFFIFFKNCFIFIYFSY